MKKLLISIFLLVVFTGNLLASDGASFSIDVFQHDTQSNTNVPVYSDTFDIIAGSHRTGFVGPISLDIELLSADTSHATFNAHLVTLSIPAFTFSNKYAVEYSLPARIENITAKNDTKYLLTISPLEYKTNLDTSCVYDQSIKSVYTAKPTAYTDIYYVPSTFGDFYFDSIKELMESNYRLFRDFLKLNLPGKINIFVPPCLSETVIWDKRFGTMVDPTKASGYAVYSRNFKTVDPFIVNHAAALKTFGYSPPFLSEGLANYFSFGMYEMKKIHDSQENIPLSKMVRTYEYHTIDGRIADKSSATFVRYLIDQYSLDTFLKLYVQSDDINLGSTLQSVYNKSVSDLETEWLNYVDTFTIPLKAYNTFARSAEMMMNYDLAEEYFEVFYSQSATNADSLKALSSLKKLAFFNGDYVKASDYQKNNNEIIPNASALDNMVLGSYQLMQGDTAGAIENLQKAYEVSPNENLVKFNLAHYYKVTGNYAQAIKLLETNFSNQKNAGAQMESRIILAEAIALSKPNDSSSQIYFREAENYLNRIAQSNYATAGTYLWLGRAQVGLGNYDDAIRNLQIALFLESRAFYLGLIELYLGKAYMQTGDSLNAKRYLESVIAEKSAWYHKQEAAKLLTQIK